jgi:hypothetical protein
VKNPIALLVAGIALIWGSVAADYILDDASRVQIPTEDDAHYTLQVRGDWILKSRHRDHGYSGHISFNYQEAEFDAVVYYNDCYKEAIKLGLAYERTWLHWNDNPFFQRKKYDTVSLSSTYITHRLADWRWILQGTINIDADKWQFSDYTDYDILLWGRYDYCQNLGMHFGMYAETGMKLDRVWPVLGFDWKFRENWQLNAIFPLNVSLIYTCNEAWSIALAGRVFNERQRAGKKGGFSEAVWRYQNTGAEVAINNNWCTWLTSNFHAGYTFGGKLKVANRHTHHSHRFKFKSAPYFGGEFVANF